MIHVTKVIKMMDTTYAISCEAKLGSPYVERFQI